jgi:hypothetical protein
MSTIHRSRSLVFGIATMFAFTQLAPVAVTAQEEVAVTAEEVAALAPVAAPVVAGTSGDDVRAARALAAEHALQSGDIGSMQEEHLYAIVAAAPSWDATSGYGSVEASRAAASALLAPVAAPSWDETSGYRSVETSRATIEHSAASTTQVPADVRWAPAGSIAPDSSGGGSEATNPHNLPAALASGTRTESAHLATVALPADTVRVNSDDRIANELFDEPRGYGSVGATCTRTSTRTCTQR